MSYSRNLFLTVMGPRKSKIKAVIDLVSSENHFLVYRWPSSSCVLTWKKRQESSPASFIKILILLMRALWGFRWQSVCLQCGGPGFEPWVGKIPWRRKWQPTSVLLPGESYGQRSLVGYSPWGHTESDMTEWLHFLHERSTLITYLVTSQGARLLLLSY